MHLLSLPSQRCSAFRWVSGRGSKAILYITFALKNTCKADVIVFLRKSDKCMAYNNFKYNCADSTLMFYRFCQIFNSCYFNIQ